jgi:hypothetical protein
VVAVTHPADPHRVDLRPAGRHRVDLLLVGAAAVHLTRRVDLRPADPHLADLPRVAPVGRRTSLVDPAGLVARADRAAPERTSPAARVDLVVPVAREHTSRVDPAAQAAPAIRADPAGLVVRVGLAAQERTVRVDRRLLVHRAAPRHRRIDRLAPTTAAVLSGAVPTTHHTASAHPTTVRRHHPHSAGSAGTTVLLPVGLRRTGTGRHLRVAGMVHRLLAVGTVPGVARRST